MADSTSENKEEEQTSVLPAAASENYPKNIGELTDYIQFLLQQVQEKFQHMSEQILTRINILDEMGTRIDDLEKNISDLMVQAEAVTDK